MKKHLLNLTTIIVGTLLFFGILFYWNNLRGALPAIAPPSKDISKLVPQTPGPAENLTGMPLKLPDGFGISIFAKDLPGARVMTFDQSSRLLVSLTSAGKVVALPDEDVNGQADRQIVLLSGLRKPHGLDFRCEGSAGVQRCFLYVAEEDKVMLYDYDQSVPKASNGRKIVDLPFGGGHFTRTIKFGPDGKLYVSIGSSCNVCDETDERRAAIYSINADGSDFKRFASGLRNTVFFTWNKDGQMWGTDMGRDLIGDDVPPEEVNVIEEGKNYGWPNCYGNKTHDTNFDKKQYVRDPCEDTMAPRVEMQAHSAPLGLAFVPEEGWPEDYWYDLIVAFHGSWNRTVPTGYKIVRIKLDKDGKYQTTEDFITGWLVGKEGKSALGRPVDILTLPGGYMYVSDDKAGVIYKISYMGNE